MGASAAVPVGDVFIEDVCGSEGLVILPGLRVWARQLDTEEVTTLDVSLRAGGSLWALGWKTEVGENGLAVAADGLALEILGAFHMTNGGVRTRR